MCTRAHALVQEIVEHDRVSAADMDFNMHMNNAVYNSLTDFSRIRFFLRLSKKPVSFLRKFRIANGGLSMFFIRELRFNQRFRIRTRVIGMDRKWLIFAHIFESPNGSRVRLLRMCTTRVWQTHALLQLAAATA